ncbi:hypothetical protein [Meiothermus sp.]|uniref:hypothetical protein n=1 Tax=Meiothermus sp. TaxID=1955249 RepID=UPI0021DF1128|nr:hypothetical protein [Meiothermus sp.]GIW32870.1 MAG: hypothetical protein KatS3mg072_0203 [Meiothermus sp.]
MVQAKLARGVVAHGLVLAASLEFGGQDAAILDFVPRLAQHQAPTGAAFQRVRGATG